MPAVTAVSLLPIIVPPEVTRHLKDVSDSHVERSQAVAPCLATALAEDRPMLAPATVTLVDPVLATLLRCAALTCPSTEYKTLVLATRCIAEIDARRLPSADALARHRVDESDSQLVRSHAVVPNWPYPLCDASAIPAPCTVRLTAPVETTLVRLTVHTAVGPTEVLSVTLPTQPPTVMDIRRLPSPTRPDKHISHVSDSHLVASHPVGPTLAVTVCIQSPPLDPCKLTLVDPVDAKFMLCSTLSAPSATEYTTVKLPGLTPADTARRLLPIDPLPIWHRTDVSDSHEVPSHVECPPRPAPLLYASPNPLPRIVTLLAPVPAALARLNPLPTPNTNENPAVVLAVSPPVVTNTRRLPTAPCPVWHRTDVSASHVVCSQPVALAIPAVVDDLRPMLAPCSVMLADPVAAALASSSTLNASDTAEYTIVMLPMCTPEDMDTLPLPITPCPV